jgi:hypothetical protein
VSEFELTDEQRQIVDAVASGHNVVVKALAGTGKTSTLAAVARHLGETQPDKRLLYLAFNKVTADEAKGRMPSNVEALTSNAMARRGGHRHIGRRVSPKSIRGRELVERLAVRGDLYVGSTRVASPFDLVRLATRTMERWCQSADEIPTRRHVPRVSPGEGGDIHRALQEITYAAERRASTPEAADAAAAAALEGAWTKIADRVVRIVGDWWSEVMNPESDMPISFDQEVKAWALLGPRFDQPGSGARGPVDIVLYDEAQDTNDVTGALVQAQSIQQVYVGDQNQAIYAWRGAVDYLDKVQVDTHLALTASWRFGPQVAHYANAFLALIGTDERVTGNGSPATIGPIETPDAIVCRTNAGLLEAAVAQDKAGKKVGVPKGMKRELKTLAETVAWMRDGARKPMFVHEDLSDFADWDEVRKEAKENPGGSVARLVKLVSAIPIADLLALVERLTDVDQAFKGRPTWDVMVTTAHKAKGLEWDAVVVGDDFPQPRVDEDGTTILPDPENLRLAYVTVTRAKKALHVGSLAYCLKEAGMGAPPALDQPVKAGPVAVADLPHEGDPWGGEAAFAALNAGLAEAQRREDAAAGVIRLPVAAAGGEGPAAELMVALAGLVAGSAKPTGGQVLAVIESHMLAARIAERQAVAAEIEAKATTDTGKAVVRFVQRVSREMAAGQVELPA